MIIRDRICCGVCHKWFVYAENSKMSYRQWLGTFLDHMDKHLKELGVIL